MESSKIASLAIGKGNSTTNHTSTAYMTKITSPLTISLANNRALVTVAKVTGSSGYYDFAAPLNSLLITLVENQTGSAQSVTIGDFQYQYLLTTGSPLYYKIIGPSSQSGPYFVALRNASGNTMSILFDLNNSSDAFSSVMVIPNGKYTFGPLD